MTFNLLTIIHFPSTCVHAAVHKAGDTEDAPTTLVQGAQLGGTHSNKGKQANPPLPSPAAAMGAAVFQLDEMAEKPQQQPRVHRLLHAYHGIAFQNLQQTSNVSDSGNRSRCAFRYIREQLTTMDNIIIKVSPSWVAP